MTRQEHLEWCKKRALEYCDMDDPNQALASMISDLRKHSETANHAGVELGVAMMMAGHLNTSEKMRNFIQGFN